MKLVWKVRLSPWDHRYMTPWSWSGRLSWDPSANNIILGANSAILGANNITLGANNITLGANNITLGANSATLSANNITLGANNITLGANNATLSANNTTLGGNNATLSANNTTLGGNNATLSANNITLGANSATLSANNTTPGTNNATLGANNTTLDTNSTTLGANKTTLGTHTTTLGTNNTTLSTNNTTLSTNNTTLGANNTGGANDTILDANNTLPLVQINQHYAWYKQRYTWLGTNSFTWYKHHITDEDHNNDHSLVVRRGPHHKFCTVDARWMWKSRCFLAGHTGRQRGCRLRAPWWWPQPHQSSSPQKLLVSSTCRFWQCVVQLQVLAQWDRSSRVFIAQAWELSAIEQNSTMETLALFC